MKLNRNLTQETGLAHFGVFVRSLGLEEGNIFLQTKLLIRVEHCLEWERARPTRFIICRNLVLLVAIMPSCVGLRFDLSLCHSYVLLRQELRKSYNDSMGSPASHVGGGKFMIVLPSRVVNSFFSASIKRIGTCLEDLKNNDAIRTLSYVVLVGGFSSSPLIASTVKDKFHRDGCAVITALRPDVAIVRGAVLFANNAAVFHTRKARLTYGVKVFGHYNKNDPGHVEHFPKHKGEPGEDGKPRIAVFSRHLVIGDDVPEDGGCQPHSYSPLRSDQPTITFNILASHLRDIRFPNEDECFKLGDVTVPLGMSVPFASRSVQVQFNFGGTEFSVTGVDKATGEKKQVTLNLIQEAEVSSY